MYIYTHTLHCVALRCVALHCIAWLDMTWHDMTYIATLTYTDTYLDLFENTSKKHQKTLKILAGVDPKGWPSGHVSGAVQVLKNWFGPYGHLQGTTGLTKVFPSQIWSFKHDSQGKFLWIFWTNLGQIWWFAKILSGEHFQKEMHFLRPSPGNYDSIHFNTIPGWSLSLSEAPIHFFYFWVDPKVWPAATTTDAPMSLVLEGPADRVMKTNDMAGLLGQALW